MAEAQEAPKISLAFGTRKPNQPARTKRSHPSLQDSDNEDDGNKLVEVTHFDQSAGGAVDFSKPQEKGPLVIPAQKNRDWREEARRKRQKSNLPSEKQQAELDAIIARREAEENQPAQYGLQLIEQQAEESRNGKPAEQESNESTAPRKRKTEDELALEALLNGKPSSDLVLPAVETEKEAFQRDFRSAPDIPTLEEYAAVPVEEFGAALLRGMGWKDGQEIGRRREGQPVKFREVTKRPALLGIGAKESAAAGVELGAWGKGAKNQRKVDVGYTPLSLKNKATGETISEEEYRKRLEQQKAIAEDGPDDRGSDPEQRRRKYGHADDDRDRRKDKDRGYDRYKSSRHGRDDADEDYSRRGRRDDDRDYKHRPSKRDRSSSRRRRREYSDESDHDRRDRERRRRDKDRDYEKRKRSYRRYRSPSVESDRRRRRDDSRERSYRDRR